MQNKETILTSVANMTILYQMLLAKKFNFNICIANTICPVIIMKKHVGQEVRG